MINRQLQFIVAILLTCHICLLAYAATQHSPTQDEPGHLVAGLSHWEFGKFELYRVNPPLVRLVAATPVLLAGYNEDWSGFYEALGARPEFDLGRNFVAANGERSIWLVTIARWACIPFSCSGALFCFFWSRELWRNNVAGLTSMVLWCFDPNILAHGELITPDCAAASLGLGTCYFYWRWLRKPGWKRALVAGAMLGLTELTKTSWLILFGIIPFMCLPRLIRSQSPQLGMIHRIRSAFPVTTQLLFSLLIALFVLNTVYDFDGTFTPLSDFQFVSRSLTGASASGTPGNRFEATLLRGFPVPLPKQYIIGIDVQKHDFEDYGDLSYLCGEWKKGGWWYYYAYGLAVKVPHGTQFLFVVSLLMIAAFGQPPSKQFADDSVQSFGNDIMFLLVPPGALFLLVSSQAGFGQHVRYVLPVMGFVFVTCGVSARRNCVFPVA